MPLLSTLAKQGVCIINKKLNNCMLCDRALALAIKIKFDPFEGRHLNPI